MALTETEARIEEARFGIAQSATEAENDYWNRLYINAVRDSARSKGISYEQEEFETQMICMEP